MTHTMQSVAHLSCGRYISHRAARCGVVSSFDPGLSLESGRRMWAELCCNARHWTACMRAAALQDWAGLSYPLCQK